MRSRNSVTSASKISGVGLRDFVSGCGVAGDWKEGGWVGLGGRSFDGVAREHYRVCVLTSVSLRHLVLSEVVVLRSGCGVVVCMCSLEER